MARTQICENLVNLLRNRGFINVSKVKYSGQDCQFHEYGPLGTLLRKQILNQWWDLMICQQSSVFPVEGSVIQAEGSYSTTLPNTELQDGVSFHRQTLQKDCNSKYLQIKRLTNGILPFSIASAGPCISCRTYQEEQTEIKTLLFGGLNQTKLLLQNYTSPSGINTVFDYWLQLRLSWWKKFARNPAKFSVASNFINNHAKNDISDNGNIQETNDSRKKSNNQQLSSMHILYDFPWGPEIVEEVRNMGDKYFKDLTEERAEIYRGKSSGSNKSYLPYCIECETSIEAASAAWLVDCFHERPQFSSRAKKNSARSNLVLQLHSQITPYQVSIIVVSSTSSSLTEMFHICSRLERDLQNAGLSVLNAAQHGSTMEAHFKRNDQLGIPYTVIVNNNTLRDGLINTRHRDTEVKVASHITNVVEDLSRNLKAYLE